MANLLACFLGLLHLRRYVACDDIPCPLGLYLPYLVQGFLILVKIGGEALPVLLYLLFPEVLHRNALYPSHTLHLMTLTLSDSYDEVGFESEGDSCHLHSKVPPSSNHTYIEQRVLILFPEANSRFYPHHLEIGDVVLVVHYRPQHLRPYGMRKPHGPRTLRDRARIVLRDGVHNPLRVLRGRLGPLLHTPSPLVHAEVAAELEPRLCHEPPFPDVLVNYVFLVQPPVLLQAEVHELLVA